MMSVMGVSSHECCRNLPPRSAAFFRHVSPVSRWLYPARPSEFVPKLAKVGEQRPKFLPSDVMEGGRYRWPIPDSIPEKASGLSARVSIIVSMSLDFAECDRARLARDPVFDGRFYTGVHTTGIYCRPICPVHPARSANVSFFPSAAAAEAAGFRPCLRCRPETAPFCSAWIGSRATVERGLRLIVEDGALDVEGSTVEHLAARLGVGARQLARLFTRYLQATPSKVARTARVQRAKRLIDETSLPMTEIAMQAGFGSLRRFNAVFAEVYGRPPTEIRRTRRSSDPTADVRQKRGPAPSYRPASRPMSWRAAGGQAGSKQG
jgi:AraC family transcriptional regulator, regulatory protein of adaptative response / methylated-DNA-[protein]-cysteine methyltransferase